MSYTIKPLGCDPQRIKGMSEKLIVSNYEDGDGDTHELRACALEEA